MTKVEINGKNGDHDNLARVRLTQERQNGQVPTKPKPFAYESKYHGACKGPNTRIPGRKN